MERLVQGGAERLVPQAKLACPVHCIVDRRAGYRPGDYLARTPDGERCDRRWQAACCQRVDKQVADVWNYVQIVSHLYPPASAGFARWTDGLAANVAEGWAASVEAAT